MRRIPYFISCLAVNLLLLLTLLWLVEVAFWRTSPHRELPVDGKVADKEYTWGNVVRNNRLGFRERDFVVPKPEHTIRVMVIGDSLTWGAGLAEDERYTNVAEEIVAQKSSQSRVEVLNFGVRGGPLTLYRDILYKYGKLVGADLVVIGFCLNDPQPRSQDYSAEREAFSNKFNWLLTLIADYEVVAPFTARRLRTAIYIAAEKLQLIPRWIESLDRSYAEDSEDWQTFIDALNEIAVRSRTLTQFQAIFLILNQGSSTTLPAKFSAPDPVLKQMIKWWEQAGQAAERAGFRVIDFQRELGTALPEKSLAVNKVDGHPSRAVNMVYGQKLAKEILKLIGR